MIDARRWGEVRAAFEALVELGASDRRAGLDTLGATDPDLRRQVDALLRADAELTHRLDRLDEIFSTADRDDEPVRSADPLGLTGRTVSHFRIGEVLGTGGMGVVYRAHDTHLQRPIALKFPLPGHRFQSGSDDRFLREARAAAALDHPNVCSIHEAGETEDGHLFLAMPLYDGETLKGRLARDGPLPPAEAIAITRQITAGIHAAHCAGIVHRDLKPANVMLLPDGTVRILDFGLASVRDWSLTMSGTRAGTVSYMSPEQIQGQPVDGRTDLWSIGVMLYEMVTGRRPFTGDYDVAIAHAIVHGEPARALSICPSVGSGLDALIHGLLDRDVDARPSSARNLAALLDALVESGAAVASRRRLNPGTGRRTALRIAAAIVLLTSAVQAASWLARRSGDAGTRPIRVAVLPLTRVSDATDDSYIVIGLADALATELARLQALTVPSAGSLSAHRAGSTPVPQIANALAVSHVVTVAAERVSGLVAIDVELIEPATGRRLLTRRYERPSAQLHDIQLAAQRDVVAALGLDLTRDERAVLERRATTSAEAYDLYLRGRAAELKVANSIATRLYEPPTASARVSPDDTLLGSLRVAQSLYARARETDPDYALARARLALTYAYATVLAGHSQPRLDQAQLEAETALRLHTDLPEAHEALFWHFGLRRNDLPKATEHMQLAMRGFPNSAHHRIRLGNAYRRQGKWEDAVAELERAMELEPRNPDPAVIAATTYSRLRRYEHAIRSWDRAIALDPGIGSRIIRGHVFVRWHGTADSLAAALRGIPAGEDPNGLVTFSAFQVARLQRRNEDALAVTDNSRREISFDQMLYQPRTLLRAQAYEALGQRERALADFEAARVLLVDSLAVHPDDTRMRIALGQAYAGLGRSEEAIAEARRAMDLVPLSEDSPGVTAVMGGAVIVFARAGAIDAALELVELLLTMPAGREVSVPLLRVDPAYDPLRSDPRFEELLLRFSPR